MSAGRRAGPARASGDMLNQRVSEMLLAAELAVGGIIAFAVCDEGGVPQAVIAGIAGKRTSLHLALLEAMDVASDSALREALGLLSTLAETDDEAMGPPPPPAQADSTFPRPDWWRPGDSESKP